MKQQHLKPGSQCSRLLAHYVGGNTITSLEAVKKLGILCLQRRNSDLRKRGHKVKGYDTLTKSGARIKTYFMDPVGRRSKAGV